jgi:hypothetical protein
MTWLWIGMWFPTLIGVFTIIQWIRPSKPPTDSSNIINRIRLWWFALTRQSLFVDIFPWLKRDELENLK